jgi:periplasmic protein TonB
LSIDTNNTEAVDILGEFTLEAAPTPDRLPPMLFLAALVHGILIIGVTFNAVLGDDFTEAISLEVTIIADPGKSVVELDTAEYLAQASQRGDGNTTETTRASAPAQSNVPIDNVGSDVADSLAEAVVQTESADQLISTQSEQSIKVADSPRIDPAAEASTAIALESGLEITLPLPQDRDATLLIKDENPRQLVTSVDTKESRIAGYLDHWKRKIETIGVKYFPEKGIVQGMTGSPTLQVTINASGRLDAATIRQSSGSRVLDQAALNILRRASPFDPFPEAIRVDYDQLVFAYKWRFTESNDATTASTM